MGRGRSARGGWHQPACGDGFCRITGQPAPSKVEGRTFGLLDYVIGPGRANYVHKMNRGWPLQIDMLFESDSLESRLVVEYDGARFHSDHEAADRNKNDLMYHALWPVMIMRIREAPLEPLSEFDVCVPARSTPAACARATLLHLLHRTWPKPDLRDRIAAFIDAGRPVGGLSCRECVGIEERMASRTIGGR